MAFYFKAAFVDLPTKFLQNDTVKLVYLEHSDIILTLMNDLDDELMRCEKMLKVSEYITWSKYLLMNKLQAQS